MQLNLLETPRRGFERVTKWSQIKIEVAHGAPTRIESNLGMLRLVRLEVNRRALESKEHKGNFSLREIRL